MTLAVMAARLQRGGWDITEVSVQHIEARRRSITDGELLALLKALGAKLTDLESGTR